MPYYKVIRVTQNIGGGQEGGSPGEKEAGRVREAGVEGQEAGFPRWREAMHAFIHSLQLPKS